MDPVETSPVTVITFADARSRVLITAVQASAGFTLAVAGLVVARTFDARTVVATALGSFLVPVATAIHRLSGAWLAAKGEPEA